MVKEFKVQGVRGFEGFKGFKGSRVQGSKFKVQSLLFTVYCLLFNWVQDL